ncbi:hypothetical protein KSP39_PZI008748 [Platanthera zijinensis]|uniref:Uncharacterized protein n=1 Tax=Platanthera zijinensis TaxID=2320716 RepID=A0AAP0BKN0_9ASPA
MAIGSAASVSGLFKFVRPSLRPQSTDISAAVTWGVAATTTALWLVQLKKRKKKKAKSVRRDSLSENRGSPTPTPGRADNPSPPQKGSLPPAREDVSAPSPGQAGTVTRKTFRPGRGKPLHLLFGKEPEGEPGPSRPSSVDDSRHAAGVMEPRAGAEEEGDEDEEEVREEEREDAESSPFPSSDEMEEFLDAAGNGRNRRKRVTVLLSKLARRERANSSAVKEIRGMVERRMTVMERDYSHLISEMERQDTLIAETSPSRHVARIRDQARLIILGCTAMTAYFNPRVPPRTGRQGRGRWRWEQY